MTGDQLAALNKWNQGSAAQSPLAAKFGWTPQEVMQLGDRGIGPVNLGQMTLDSNTLQILRSMLKTPTAAPAAAQAQPAQGNPSASPWGINPTIQSGSGTVGGSGSGGSSTMADGQQPESVALQQMAQIDPASEALRQAVAQSYLTPLQQAGAPTAAQFQSYLDLYKQIDPTSFAATQQLGSDLAAQEALGTQLDPATQRDVEQATRRAQGVRGNVYGTPQLVEEAMTRGQAGLALQQQRQQALQSYLASGVTPGQTALNLWNQQQNQLRAAQGAAVGYLGSGQTPYQAGASYLNTAENRAASAAQGGPVYSPQSPSSYYTGAGASSYPQYGLDMSQLAGSWYNNINSANLQRYNLQQAYSQKSGGASGGMIGGGIGTALGGIVGSIVPGVGTAIGGALGGALGSAAGSAFSA